MADVADITSLPEYDDFVAAQNELDRHRQQRQQKERKIANLFSQYKAKQKEAELANSFGQAQELKDQAQAIKDEATTKQTELETFISNTPMGRGPAKNALVTAGKPFIEDQEQQAQQKLNDCRDILEAIQSTRNKLDKDAFHFIPSVTHRLSVLKTINSEF